jgi:PKD repeat protein
MKKMKLICNFLLLCLCINLTAQNEFSKWYFGTQAGLDFNTNPPTILTNGIVNNGEGVATICDNTGSLLFYTDGIGVANSAHALMANGSPLFGNGSSTQSAMIVKQPGNNNLFYIFTVALSNSSNGARYSIVDMNLAAGLGSVTVLNAPMYNPCTEKQVAVRHCNGKDAWIVSHHFGTNEFRAYLLSSSGLSASPVISPIGEAFTTPGTAPLGQMKISPDGKKLAMAMNTTSVTSASGGFHLFDFDAATGVVSNSLVLLSGNNIIAGTGAYGVEFSPDGSKLYGSTSVINTYSCALHQWNICAGSNQAIVASQYSISLTLPFVVPGSLQRAIDGKLYLAMGNTQYLSVINNPNATGSAMGFSLNAIDVSPKMCRLGLPNYINGYTHTVPALFTNTLACQTASFTVPPVPTFSSGCSTTPYLYSNYLWDFGEAAAGAANSSTLTNPAHTYSSTGTYTVSLILYGACTNDTLKKVVTIATPGPTVNVAGNFAICKGDKYTYTASGASSYVWSNSSTVPTVALNPVTTTSYSVSGTLNGCTLSKTFTIEVNPCTGINALQNNGTFHVFPNPFKESLSVQTLSDSEITLTNLEGRVILKSKLHAGNNEINTSELQSGIYFIQANNAENTWRGRFVKE